MEANDGNIPNPLPGALAGAVANATSDPAKGKIPPAKIIEILKNSTLREEVMPLLEKVLDIISDIDGLDTAINEVFKTKTNDNQKLAEALTALQKKLQSIYLAKSQPNERTSNGGKRRKSKKRNYYKKRRATKRR